MSGFVSGKLLINVCISENGKLSPVIATDELANLDERLVHRGVTGRSRDQLDRTVDLECTLSAGSSMPIHQLMLNEIGMVGTVNGSPTVADVEMDWPADYLELISDSDGAVRAL